MPTYPYTQAMPNLAPGRYLVLAQPQPVAGSGQFDVEFRNPKVLEKLLTEGTVVTLSANQNAEIQVPIPRAKDTY